MSAVYIALNTFIILTLASIIGYFLYTLWNKFHDYKENREISDSEREKELKSAFTKIAGNELSLKEADISQDKNISKQGKKLKSESKKLRKDINDNEKAIKKNTKASSEYKKQISSLRKFDKGIDKRVDKLDRYYMTGNKGRDALIKGKDKSTIRLTRGGKVMFNVNNPNRVVICDKKGKNCSQIVTRRMLDSLPVETYENEYNGDNNNVEEFVAQGDKQNRVNERLRYGDVAFADRPITRPFYNADGSIEYTGVPEIDMKMKNQVLSRKAEGVDMIDLERDRQLEAFDNQMVLSKEGQMCKRDDKGNLLSCKDFVFKSDLLGTSRDEALLASIRGNVAKGEKGEKGDRGKTGPRGRTGKRGPRGKAGPRGKTGPRGRRGKRGQKGDAGEDGRDFDEKFSNGNLNSNEKFTTLEESEREFVENDDYDEYMGDFEEGQENFGIKGFFKEDDFSSCADYKDVEDMDYRVSITSSDFDSLKNNVSGEFDSRDITATSVINQNGKFVDGKFMKVEKFQDYTSEPASMKVAFKEPKKLTRMGKPVKNIHPSAL
jgi:hypothetical protein